MRQLKLTFLLFAVSSAIGCTKVNFAATDYEQNLSSVNRGTILINGGAPYTNNSAVTLTLNSVAEEMYITNDSTCEDGGQWETYSTSKPWQLSQTNMQTKVYALFRLKGVVSECHEDAIVHDDIAPVISLTPPAAKFVAGSPEHLTYSVYEDGSGLANVNCTRNSVAFTCGAQMDLNLSAILADINYLLNKYTYAIVAIDNAGNSSLTSSASFKVLPKTETRTLANSVSTSSGAPDVLFVIDHSSGTMNYQYNKNFQDGFGALTTAFSGLDWRAALITADSRASTTLDDLRGGLLTPVAGLNPKAYVIDPTMQFGSTYFADTITFLDAAKGNTDKPAAIKSSIMAMERKSSSPNNAFFRTDSLLSVVIYSDHDETLEAGETYESKIQAFRDGVVASFGPAKRAAVYSIIRLESQVSECQTNGNRRGIVYDRLAQQTGGFAQSICEPDFSAVMTRIGRDISEKVRQFVLSCEPYFDPEEQTAPIIITESGNAVNIPYTLSGSVLKFVNALPAGDYSISYLCRVP
jgi:hypothetical protein